MLNCVGYIIRNDVYPRNTQTTKDVTDAAISVDVLCTFHIKDKP